MRTLFVFLCAALATVACTEKDARPAKEAVAEAKGAAADAKETAREAAAAVKATTEEAKHGADVAAAQADRAVTSAARAVQDGVVTAAQTTRSSAENVAQGVRELGGGGVVTGQVRAFSGLRLALKPEAAGPTEFRVDSRTRYLLHGASLAKAALPSGTRVKATYVVESDVPVATEVEVLPQ
jgi:hypothetical protein